MHKRTLRFWIRRLLAELSRLFVEIDVPPESRCQLIDINGA